jgi:hypothetical protein
VAVLKTHLNEAGNKRTWEEDLLENVRGMRSERVDFFSRVVPALEAPTSKYAVFARFIGMELEDLPQPYAEEAMKAIQLVINDFKAQACH